MADEPVSRGKLFWTWDGCANVFPAGRCPVRMHIAGYQLPEGKTGLVVISPLAPTDKVVTWLKKTGVVCFIVAPNKHHSRWLSAMREAFPAAVVVAPVELSRQKPKLPVDVRITPLAGTDDLPGSWPLQELDMLPLQGADFLEELAFYHKPSETLILTDSVWNFDDALLRAWQLGSRMRWFMSLVGYQKSCCMPSAYRFKINDPVALQASFDHILSSWEFSQVSMCHGSFIDQGGKQALQEGSYAFVKDLVNKKQQAAARKEAGELAGTLPAMLTAGAVICTAVGIGIAGIMQAQQR